MQGNASVNSPHNSQVRNDVINKPIARKMPVFNHPSNSFYITSENNDSVIATYNHTILEHLDLAMRPTTSANLNKESRIFKHHKIKADIQTRDLHLQEAKQRIELNALKKEKLQLEICKLKDNPQQSEYEL